MFDGERVYGRLCSPTAGDRVRLAGASQIALNTSAEAIKSYLLCQKVNTHPVPYFSKREPRLFSRTAGGFPGTELIIA